MPRTIPPPHRSFHTRSRSLGVALCATSLTSTHAQTAGTLDPAFGNGGKTTFNFGLGNSEASAVVVQPDGKIIAAGDFDGNTIEDGSDGNFALARYNPNGTLDMSFDFDGRLTTPTGGDPDDSDVVRDIALQLDGKVIIVGHDILPFVGMGSDREFFTILRYNIDGALDTTFATGGKISQDFGSPDQANAVAVQPDGKIVVAGNAAFGSYDMISVLARYNADGTLDRTFGRDGKVTSFDYDYGLTSVNAIAIQPDGKIIIAGDGFALARYNADGTPDTTFGTLDTSYMPPRHSPITTNFGAGTTNIYSIALQSDGKIVAVGSAVTRVSTNGSNISDFAIARYDTNGKLDTSFDTDGKATTDIATQFTSIADSALSVAIQSDGKIVVGGFAFMGSSNSRDMTLVRYNADGSLDTTFDGDGKATTNFGGTDYANSIAIQPDGKIISGGETCSTTTGNCFVALSRYNTNGTPDSTFSGTGQVATTTGFDDGAYTIALQRSGKIIAAGYSFVDGGYGFGILRYNTDGTLDSSFGTNGKVTTKFGGSADFTNADLINAVAIQPDGNIVAAGRAFVGVTRDFALARYLGDAPQAIPSISINDVAIVEPFGGTRNAVFTVTLSAASDASVSVNYATSSGTATIDQDYLATSGTLTFAAGVQSLTVSVPILGDVVKEPTENFFVNLSSPVNAAVADVQAQGSIISLYIRTSRTRLLRRIRK